MKAAAQSNLKSVTLELGGKSPNIIFDDADLEQAVSWSTFGLFFNHGQCCCAGSRIYVQETVYDKFLELLTAKVKSIKVGSPFAADTFQGPQTSQLQFDRISEHIKSGKDEGATVHIGGERHGTEGYFLQPTIFTDVKPHMRIVKEEIFGPVVVVAKFKDEADIVRRLSLDASLGADTSLPARRSPRPTTPCTDSQRLSSLVTFPAPSTPPSSSRPE
jgi:aldehyde dehydrogenase (NAD+)